MEFHSNMKTNGGKKILQATVFASQVNKFYLLMIYIEFGIKV
jgi:hypothetical protein